MNKDACMDIFNNQFDKLNIDNIEKNKLDMFKSILPAEFMLL